jgi:hypothetical protein
MSIEEAREVIADAFAQDPDLRRRYVDNVACIIRDRLGIRDVFERGLVAEEIIQILFEREEE